MVEHRAVADDRVEIERALRDLSSRVDLLFVTGGLGPTSDDFTRDVLSMTFRLPLEFDPPSWTRIEERFRARGLVARPIQRQQCYFPKGARILENPAGTANAFGVEIENGGRRTRIYALPGPPVEIDAVWTKHLAIEMESFVPAGERDSLLILRTLGKGESEIAELVEEAILGSPLRVGYRAHLPYVEVKLWFQESERSEVTPILQKIESLVRSVLVNKDDEDVVDVILRRVAKGQKVRIHDAATEGQLHARISDRAREAKGSWVPSVEGRLEVTSFLAGTAPSSSTETTPADLTVSIEVEGSAWQVTIVEKGQSPRISKIEPTGIYAMGSDRGRRFMTEKALIAISELG